MKRQRNWRRLSSMSEVFTLAQAQAALQAQGLERLDAQLLLLHVLGIEQNQRSWLLAHDTDTLAPSTHETLQAMALRRLAGEPLAYITGRKDFFDLNLQVGPGVLVPRPDTETLVSWALELVPSRGSRVLDLGTGSGAIALAIKVKQPAAQVWAVDLSEAALDYARNNAQQLGLTVTLLAGHWFDALPSDTDLFDCIVSNPPYVAMHDPHLTALHAEPISALASGPEGLDDLSNITAKALAHLAPGGWLLLEHGYDQASAVRALLHHAGFTHIQSRTDLNGVERCSGGQRPTTES